MTAYYNEIDPFAAQWLRNLISAGHIAPGEVDERSIADIRPDDLTGFRQCHFFAGIGGWSFALRLAGWPDDRPVWTGSCPCQPFSVAGKKEGFDDERHLWPDWRWLIDQCRPATIFGEQVASADGRTWLSGVRSDLETMGYEVGAADLCAASIGAPHIRQRLWFVANSNSKQAQRRESSGFHSRIAASGAMGGDLGDSINQRLERYIRDESHRDQPGRIPPIKNGSATQASGNHGLADADFERRNKGGLPVRSARQSETEVEQSRAGFWSSINWIPCADGKARPIKPGIEPLVDGISGRVGQLRAYGNAIVPQVGAEFIKAYMSVNSYT